MRYNIFQRFNQIRIVNLHGGKGFVRNSGADDQNVFEIMQSVAIGSFSLKSKCTREFLYVDVIGSREAKYQQLASVEGLRQRSEVLEPSGVNQWLFMPMDTSQMEIWEKGISLENVFREWGAAVKTNRNGLAVAFTAEELTSQIEDFIDLTIDDDTIEKKYSFSSNYQWKTGVVRRKLAVEGFDENLITPYLFRPFDVRYIYWHSNIVFNMRGDKMEMFRSSEKNLGLMFSRTTIKDEYSNFLVTDLIPDHDCLEKTKVAGLRIPTNISPRQDLLWMEQDAFSSNLTEVLVSRFAHLEISADERDRVIFNYMYGLFQSEWYRKEFLDFLKIDFPRLLVPKQIETLNGIAQIGEALINLHCMSSHRLDEAPSRFDGPSDFILGKATWVNRSIEIEMFNKISSAKTNSRFLDVGEDTWNYQVGGLRVCEKWLKDRRNRNVTRKEIDSFEKILLAIELSIEETKRLSILLPPVKDVEALFV
jgi:predicted helicase